MHEERHSAGTINDALASGILISAGTPSAVPATDPSDDDELFEERAAIREFDGKLSRDDAEYLAARDVAANQRYYLRMTPP